MFLQFQADIKLKDVLTIIKFLKLTADHIPR